MEMPLKEGIPIQLYQILLGQTEGPRLGSFVKLFGIQDTINLIDEKNKA